MGLLFRTAGHPAPRHDHPFGLSSALLREQRPAAPRGSREPPPHTVRAGPTPQEPRAGFPENAAAQLSTSPHPTRPSSGNAGAVAQRGVTTAPAQGDGAEKSGGQRKTRGRGDAARNHFRGAAARREVVPGQGWPPSLGPSQGRAGAPGFCSFLLVERYGHGVSLTRPDLAAGLPARASPKSDPATTFQLPSACPANISDTLPFLSSSSFPTRPSS